MKECTASERAIYYEKPANIPTVGVIGAFIQRGDGNEDCEWYIIKSSEQQQ